MSDNERGFRCPHCAGTNTQVIDSRTPATRDYRFRRRECRGCGKRFTTYELSDGAYARLLLDANFARLARKYLTEAQAELADTSFRELPRLEEPAA